MRRTAASRSITQEDSVLEAGSSFPATKSMDTTDDSIEESSDDEEDEGDEMQKTCAVATSSSNLPIPYKKPEKTKWTGDEVSFI